MIWKPNMVCIAIYTISSCIATSSFCHFFIHFWFCILTKLLSSKISNSKFFCALYVPILILFHDYYFIIIPQLSIFSSLSPPTPSSWFFVFFHLGFACVVNIARFWWFWLTISSSAHGAPCRPRRSNRTNWNYTIDPQNGPPNDLNLHFVFQ